ncbi:hypothetical protein [Archangium lansingense]|uniref:Uncharacterized protein n=1 Tax=Archangium lansingense TaxID=2995310 RepID=A0ABT4AB62_9BACT|nr:hypothetical protein [Archangium lansinium]MCY1078897.1 hypothetical protein [Archangium lansinium]
MEENKPQSLREQSRNWICNQFSITNHDGDTVTLLRKLADSIEQLGAVDIMDITYRRPPDPSITEITVTVYFMLSE